MAAPPFKPTGLSSIPQQSNTGIPPATNLPPSAPSHTVSGPSSASNKGFDTKKYPEVLELQTELDAILDSFMRSGVVSTIEKNPQFKAIIDQLSGSKKFVEQSKEGFLGNIKKLFMGNGKTNQIDGKWGKLTSDAVTAVLLVAKGMVGVCNKMGQKCELTFEDCHQAYKVLQAKLSTQRRAKALLPFMKKIKTVIDEFPAIVTEYIKNPPKDVQQSAPATHATPVAQVLSDKEQEFLKTYGNDPSGLAYNTSLSYNTLTSMEEIKKHLRNSGFGDNVSKDTIIKMLEDLKQQSNKFIEQGY